MAMTPAAAAEGAEYVFLCVGDDPDVLAVTTGADGVLETMGEGAVLVDHTTASAVIARTSMQRPRRRVSVSSMRRSRADKPAPRTVCSR